MASQSDVRRGRLLTIESVAGWVFADLLLVLFIVGLGTAVPVEPPPAAEPEPKVTKSPKPPPIVGMKTEAEPIPITFDGGRLLGGGASARREGAAVCRRIGRKVRPMEDERAAMVLVFGGAPEVSTGQAVARAVTRQLRCADPSVFARNPATRAFWDGALPLGKARLEVFLFTTKQKTTTGD